MSIEPRLSELAPTRPNAVVLAGRADRRQVRVGNGERLSVIAGPCQMESRAHALEMAHALREIADRLDVGLIYKTSFAEIGQVTGLTKITDLHYATQCAEVAQAVDVLQIPAFLCRQTDLLLAAAATGRPVNVKKGQFLAPWDMKNVVAKITQAGNPNVLACERGVSFGYNTLVSDMRALPELARIGCPVVFDATHSAQQPGGQGASSGGQRQYVPVLARAAVAVGVACVFLETHPDPDRAPSDGPNMLALKDFAPLVADLLAFDALAKWRSA